MLSEGEYALGKLLDYYSELNVKGEITELEMESKMDNVRILGSHEIIKKWKQVQRKLKRKKDANQS